MKKLKFIITVLVLVFISGVALSSSDKDYQPRESLRPESAGLVCTVLDAETGQVIARCWFCNCGKFVTAVLLK